MVSECQQSALYTALTPHPALCPVRLAFFLIPSCVTLIIRMHSALPATVARQGLKPSTPCMLLFVEKHQNKLSNAEKM